MEIPPELQRRIEQIDNALALLPDTAFIVNRADSEHGLAYFAGWTIIPFDGDAVFRIIAPGPRRRDQPLHCLRSYFDKEYEAGRSDGETTQLWYDLVSGKWLGPEKQPLTTFILDLVAKNFSAYLDSRRYVILPPVK